MWWHTTQKSRSSMLWPQVTLFSRRSHVLITINMAFMKSSWWDRSLVTSHLLSQFLITAYNLALPCSWLIPQAYIILTPGQYFHQWSIPLRTLLTFNVQMWFWCKWVAYSALAEEWRVIAYGAPFAIVVGLHRVYMPLVVSGTFTIGLHPLLHVWLKKENV